MPEEHLGPVDVADPGERGLVHEQPSDGSTRAVDPAPGPLGVGVRAKGVGPGRREHSCPLLGSDEPTPLRPPEVCGLALGRDAQAQGRGLGRRAVRTQAQPADQTQMDPHRLSGVEVDEQVLADRLGPLQHRLVEQRGGVREASLRAGHCDNPAAEGVRQGPGHPVDDVPFRHSHPLVSPAVTDESTLSPWLTGIPTRASGATASRGW